MRITNLLRIFFFACICCVACNQKQQSASSDDKLPLDLVAIPVKEGGWGYEIYVDHKLFIRQKTIPAVSGFQAFQSKEDALKIGNLVMEKMKKGQRLPPVSMEELKSAGIAIKN